MRIVKKTLKGDLMGNTGFKSVPSRRRGAAGAPDDASDAPAQSPASPSPATGGKPVDPAQRVLANVRDDDITVITEPVPVRHGKAIVLNKDHQEVPPPGTKPSAAATVATPPGAPGAAGHGPPSEPAGAPMVKRRAKAEKADGGSRASAAASAAASGAPSAHPVAAPARTGGHADASGYTLHAGSAAHTPAQQVNQPRGLVLDGGSVTLARAVLSEALFRDLGAAGTKVTEPRGAHFVLHPKVGAGVVRTMHNLVLPLPEGHATNHAADIVIELENGAILVLDIVTSTVTANDMKALSFDALQLRRLDLAFSVLVFVRTASGMPQDQAIAIGHGYDFHFGVPEDQLHSEQAFAALRARIQQWVRAASAK